MTPGQLEAAFASWLNDHGYKTQQAKKLGWLPMMPELALKKWPRLPAAHVRPGFLIPYYGLDGKLNGHRRWRNLDCEPRGFAGLTGDEPPAYITELDSEPALYIPRLVPSNFRWSQTAGEVSQLILITEGEAKAECATFHGFPTLGLGGVWSFRSARRAWRLLPEFEQFTLAGRAVYVVFDSDAASDDPKKYGIRLAQNVLCGELTLLGARVHAVIVPAQPELTKTGLDDFLLRRGPEALRQLLNDTPEWAASRELARMNRRAIFVDNLPAVHMLEDGANLSEQKFYFRHAALTYSALEVKGKQTVMVAKNTAREWVRWPGRFSCSRLTFDPAAPPREVTESGEYNLYPGLAVQPRAGDVDPWLRLRDHLFPDEEARRWFTCWMAWPLQRLAERASPKMHSCAALISETQRTGKGLIVAPVRAIYGRNAMALTPAHFRGDFNEWARHLLFAQGNEITGKQSRDFADDLKALISEPEIRIREMYMPAYCLPNHLNLYFTSNHHDAFFLDFSDQRFFIHRTPEVKLLDVWGRTAVDAYAQWAGQPESAAALLDYLLRVRLGNWDHRTPPLTIAKLEMQEQSANQLDLWAVAVKENPELRLAFLAERRLWTAEELLALFDPFAKRGFTARAVGVSLRRAGWHQVNRGYQVRGLDGCGKKPLWSLPRYAPEVSVLSERALAKQFNHERKINEPKEKF